MISLSCDIRSDPIVPVSCDIQIYHDIRWDSPKAERGRLSPFIEGLGRQIVTLAVVFVDRRGFSSLALLVLFPKNGLPSFLTRSFAVDGHLGSEDTLVGADPHAAVALLSVASRVRPDDVSGCRLSPSRGPLKKTVWLREIRIVRGTMSLYPIGGQRGRAPRYPVGG